MRGVAAATGAVATSDAVTTTGVAASIGAGTIGCHLAAAAANTDARALTDAKRTSVAAV